ncbi:hypothetical protein BKA56DRAFT_246168 [Ilyonectria sp. MPI-CAGE-AT-0026]|nr:hypothetical protein BKA56DRAFT_246168 [Ilyonectria sp. MPI-CAGE-AT-0026]
MHVPPIASSTVKTHVARHPRPSCSPEQRLHFRCLQKSWAHYEWDPLRRLVVPFRYETCLPDRSSHFLHLRLTYAPSSTKPIPSWLNLCQGLISGVSELLMDPISLSHSSSGIRDLLYLRPHVFAFVLRPNALIYTLWRRIL